MASLFFAFGNYFSRVSDAAIHSICAARPSLFVSKRLQRPEHVKALATHEYIAHLPHCTIYETPSEVKRQDADYVFVLDDIFKKIACLQASAAVNYV